MLRGVFAKTLMPTFHDERARVCRFNMLMRERNEFYCDRGRANLRRYKTASVCIGTGQIDGSNRMTL